MFPSINTSIDFSRIKESLDKSIQDRECITAPFPLWALLILHEKTNNISCINYMEGFKLLASWLAPIKLSIYKGSPIYISDLLVSYEAQQMEYVLSIPQDDIVIESIKHVIPRLNKNITLEENTL